MNQKYFLSSFLASLIFITAGVASVYAKPQEVNCFSVYSFQNVEFTSLRVSPDEPVAGKPIDVSFSVQNKNIFPIAEGMVFAKVYRKNVDSVDTNFLVDQFTAISNINLWPSEGKDLKFSWTPQGKLIGGDYYVDLFFESSKQFNLSGLSFLPSMVGKRSTFKLGGEKNGYWLDDTNYLFNGLKSAVSGDVPAIQNGSLSLGLNLKNTLKSGTVTVTLKVHQFDVLKGDDAILSQYTKNQEVKLNSPEIPLKYQLDGLVPGTYVVEIKVTGENQQSISNIRFAYWGNKAKIIFSGLVGSQIQTTKDVNVFTCFSNSTDSANSYNGKIDIALVDKQSGKTLGQTSWDGTIVKDPKAFKDIISGIQGYGDVILKTKLTGPDGKVMDETQTEYDFSKFSKLPEDNSQALRKIITYASVIILIILVGFFIFVIKTGKFKKYLYNRKMMSLFVFICLSCYSWLIYVQYSGPVEIVGADAGVFSAHFEAVSADQPCLANQQGAYAFAGYPWPPFVDLGWLTFNTSYYTVANSRTNSNISNNSGSPSDLCNYDIPNISITGNYSGDWGNPGGSMDTPSINWVPVIDTASCPSTYTTSDGRVYTVKGPDAGVLAYYFAPKGIGGCPSRTCVDPNVKSGVRPSCGSVPDSQWATDFDGACSACSTYQNTYNVTDSNFGLRNHMMYLSLSGGVIDDAACNEMQVNCSRKLKVVTTGPIRVSVINDHFQTCTACSDGDSDPTCSSSCTINGNSGSNTLPVDASVRTVNGALGSASVELTTYFNCFLYLDHSWARRIPKFWCVAAGGTNCGGETNGYETLQWPFAMTSGPYFVRDTYYFNVISCCN